MSSIANVVASAQGRPKGPIRTYNAAIVAVLAALAVAGAVMLAISAAELAKAEDSTTLSVIEHYVNFFATSDAPDIQLSQVTAPPGFAVESREFNWTAVSRAGESSSQSYTQFFWSGNVARASGQQQEVVMEFVNNARTPAVVSEVRSPRVPLVHPNTGLHLTEFCFVVKRERTRDAPFIADTSYSSCSHPFRSVLDNQFTASVAPATIRVRVLSFGDPELVIERFGEGSGVVRDRDITLVAGHALPLLVVGVVLLLLTLPLIWCVVIYRWHHPPDVMKHIAFSMLCCCCVDHNYPVNDPMQVATGSQQPPPPPSNALNEGTLAEIASAV